jgi:hypothetical protein
MRQVMKDLIRVENYPAYLAIVLAGLGVLNDLSQHQIQIILAILALIAVNTVTERVTFFRKLLDSRKQHARLRSREDGDFEDFHQYIEGGREIFIAALSLHFVCTQRTNDLVSGMRDGVDFKFIIVDPALPDDAMQKIAEHDERINMTTVAALRDEIEKSVSTLTGIKKAPDATGTMKLKACKGLPVLTITMVNPRARNGKMRIELRSYHRNVGPRPYFELKRENPDDTHWFNHFYEHYYVKLWAHSPEISL